MKKIKMNKKGKIDWIIVFFAVVFIILIIGMVIEDLSKREKCEDKFEYNCEQQKCFAEEYPQSELQQLKYQSCLMEKMVGDKEG